MIGLSGELKRWQEILDKVPQLVYAGEKVLRTPCHGITKEDFVSGRVKEWVEFMKKSLRDFRGVMGYGRGLAANQVGIGKQIIVTYEKDGFRVFINPQIVEESEERAMYGELCLSFVLVMGDIVRPHKIKVRYLDEDAGEDEEMMEGVMARLLQHEIAHLQGKLCLDEAVPTSLRVIRGGKQEVFGEKLKLIREV